MTINLRNVLAYMKEDLRGWDKINFEFTTTNDDVTAKADITINSINANVMIIIKAYSGGGAVFRAVFVVDAVANGAEAAHVHGIAFGFRAEGKRSEAYFLIKDFQRVVCIRPQAVK